MDGFPSGVTECGNAMGVFLAFSWIDHNDPLGFSKCQLWPPVSITSAIKLVFNTRIFFLLLLFLWNSFGEFII